MSCDYCTALPDLDGTDDWIEGNCKECNATLNVCPSCIEMVKCPACSAEPLCPDCRGGKDVRKSESCIACRKAGKAENKKPETTEPPKRELRKRKSLAVSTHGSGKTAAASRTTLKASIGFEWQCNNVKARVPGTSGKKGLVNSKVLLYYQPGGISVESDGGEVEFITCPIIYDLEKGTTTLLTPSEHEFPKTQKCDPLSVVAGQLKCFDQALNAVAFKGNKLDVKGHGTVNIICDAGRTADKSGTIGATQVTVGITLDRIPALLRYRGYWDKVYGCIDAFGCKATFDALGPNVKGLMAAFWMYIHFFDGSVHNDQKQGLKTSAFIMVRSDFYSMFHCLKPDEQTAFKAEAENIKKAHGHKFVVPGKYYTIYDSRTEQYVELTQGPTIEEWLDSFYTIATTGKVDEAAKEWTHCPFCKDDDVAIQKKSKKGQPPTWTCNAKDCGKSWRGDAGIPKDLMSPPPGYGPSVIGEFNYAMGLYETVEGLCLFELRGLGGKSFAEFCDFAGKVSSWVFSGE